MRIDRDGGDVCCLAAVAEAMWDVKVAKAGRQQVGAMAVAVSEAEVAAAEWMAQAWLVVAAAACSARAASGEVALGVVAAEPETGVARSAPVRPGTARGWAASPPRPESETSCDLCDPSPTQGAPARGPRTGRTALACRRPRT